MTTNNYTDLREKAEAATPGPWQVEDYDRVTEVVTRSNRGLAKTAFPQDAEYIAAANPSTILALLADLQTANDKATELQERIGKALAIQVGYRGIYAVQLGAVINDMRAALTPKKELSAQLGFEPDDF